MFFVTLQVRQLPGGSELKFIRFNEIDAMKSTLITKLQIYLLALVAFIA